VLGTSKSFATDDNNLIQPGYAYINLLAKVGLTKGLSLAAGVNNIFDTIGITEVEGVDGAFGADRL
jgi:outer membrane receptor protein involved in Fe transport